MLFVTQGFSDIWAEVSDSYDEISSKHNGLVNLSSSSILTLANHLSKIESVPPGMPKDPNVELETLKADVKTQGEFIRENRETFEDIALLRKKGWDAIIKKMEERGRNQNGS